jgi:NAD(P)-dependent dehydrogenase (short-subunit alcohol dehydrogenase family)
VSRRRALVTGANRGLGLGLCTVLAGRGFDVVAVCRRSSTELDTLGIDVVDGADVAEPASGEKIRAAVGEEPLDLVIANAAANTAYPLDRLEPDGDLALLEHDLRVNVVGVVRTVLATLPRLRTGSKLVFVSSSVTAPGVQPSANIGYKLAKAAVNQLSRTLAQELSDREIVVMSIDPGPTNTGLLRASYDDGRTKFDPDNAPSITHSAARLLDTVERATLDTSGSFWSPAGEMFVGPDGAPPALPTGR